MSFVENAKTWVKKSITLKLITITIIMLTLLIPKGMITSLIYERKNLSNQVIQEISNESANEQTLSGPILTIPLEYRYKNISKDKNGNETIEYHHEINYFRILPTSLNIDGHVTPEERKRGIYKAMLYKSDLNISGNFKIPPFSKENLYKVKWEEAYVTLGISDLRGIKNEIKFNIGGKALPAQSGSSITSIGSGITIPCTHLEDLADQTIPYSLHLLLNGSKRLDFTPDGDVTSVEITSDWPDPSFSGYVLPDEHEISESGFSAKWTLLQLNRNYPSSWNGSGYFGRMKESAFGFSIYKGNDHYQKSLRSVKYGAMIIALNFLVFFLVEILNKKRIHPFQYILVGLALIMFFSMLVALSEQIEYNTAYIISALITVVMVSLYSRSVLGTWKMAYLMGAILCGVYTFLYFTLQSTDYALLIGSIGLTMILGATMYFTRNINWYSNHTEEDE